SARVVAQQHIGELVAGIVRITGVWPKVQIQGIAPSGLLAVIVPVEIKAGFEAVGSPIVRQIVGEGKGLFLAAPVCLERREVAGTDAATVARKAVPDILIGKQLLELESQCRAVV